MKKHLIVGLIMVGGVTLAAQQGASQRFAVEFVKGDFPIKECLGSVRRICKGFLVLEGDRLQFVNSSKRRTVEFALPLTTITKVTNTIEQGGPSAATVAAFGVWGLASRTRDEFIYITTETDSAAGVLTFKVPKNSSPDTIAKIEFAVKRARAETSTTPHAEP